MLFQKRQKTVPMQGMSKPSSQGEQSQEGEKQQGILSRVMSGGHNYSLLSNSKTSFPPIKHNPTMPPVCGMAGTETLPFLFGTAGRPRLFSPQACFGHKAEFSPL